MERPRQSPPTRLETRNTDGFAGVVESIDAESRDLDARTLRSIQSMRGRSDLSKVESQRLAHAEAGAPIREVRGEVNGSPYIFLGVMHSPETALMQRGALENAIRNAGVVVLESAPEIEQGDGYLVGIVRSHRERLAREGKSPEEIETWLRERNMLADSEATVFFHEMEQLAKKHRKPVVTVDPHSGVGNWRHMVEDNEFGARDTYIEHEQNVHTALLGSWAAFAGTATALALRNARHNMRRDKEDPEQAPHRMSRRQFLATSSAFAGTALLAPPNFANANPAGGFMEVVAYNVSDYRNVAIARGIDRFTQSRAQGPLLFIYGDAHTSGITRYMEQPRLRDLKYDMYKSFRSIMEPVLKEYAFEERNEEAGFAWHERSSMQVS